METVYLLSICLRPRAKFISSLPLTSAEKRAECLETNSFSSWSRLQSMRLVSHERIPVRKTKENRINQPDKLEKKNKETEPGRWGKNICSLPFLKINRCCCRYYIENLETGRANVQVHAHTHLFHWSFACSSLENLRANMYKLDSGLAWTKKSIIGNIYSAVSVTPHTHTGCLHSAESLSQPPHSIIDVEVSLESSDGITVTLISFSFTFHFHLYVRLNKDRGT